MILKILLLFLSGTILGSFLNVVIFRYKPGGTILGKHLGGRSKCPDCKRTLNWYELVPILSFALQLGKCRGCKKSISWRYPIVEILSGIIVATVILMSGISVQSLIWIIVLFLLLLISFIDIRHYIIPDGLNIAIALLGVIFTAMVAFGKIGGQSLVPGTFIGSYAYIFSFTNNPWIAHLVASLTGGAFFSLIILLSRGKAMGWGDAKLALAVGLLIGWPDAILVIMISFILGALFGMVSIISNKKGLKDAIPFGPFIALATAIVFYFGQNILSLYFDFLNLAV
jgi:leader peptidase (prepilin peptidase)/N-methyltransferase